MDFNAAYPWFGQGLGEISLPQYRFVPVEYTNDADEAPVSPLRSTLRMRWRLTVDSNGRLCMQARWDARRPTRLLR